MAKMEGINVQDKADPGRDYEGSGKYRYSSIISLASALDGSGWLTPRPGRFTFGKETRYPSYGKLGGPQGRSGRVRKISPSTEFCLFMKCFLLFSLCTFSVLLCRDSPGICLCAYCTTQHKHPRLRRNSNPQSQSSDS